MGSTRRRLALDRSGGHGRLTRHGRSTHHVLRPPLTMTNEMLPTAFGFTFLLLWAMIGQIAISRR
jgi:hypothetical protein